VLTCPDCGLAIGTFKVNHPEVYGLSDAGRVFGGRFGREFFYVVFQICEFSSSSRKTAEAVSRCG
jgi:hypothetical protein